MNREETVRLTQLVKAACPAQAVDEFTANAWHGLLDDIRIEDALLAVRNLGRQAEFIAPAQIRAEVKKIRNDRLDRTEVPEPPAGWEYIDWLRHARKLIADGRECELPEQIEHPKRDVAGLIDKAFKGADE